MIRDATVGRPFKLFSNIYRLDYDLNVKLDELGFSRIYDSNAGSGVASIANETSEYHLYL